MNAKVATLKEPKHEIPVWHKLTLNMDETMAYTGIGRDKLREMTNREDCPFVLWIGNKRLIKRRILDEYIMKMYSV
ncbi:MAG: helix-turn-helix domain-containing protein [Clostridia bacterium]|uniref:excisionase n=1 Tax=Blautia producta TaxID=33035 RepID=UPI0028A4C7FB|nr:excisionase [Blautia coccoides]MDT4376932.1 excisionase [Blautia coccoides]NCC02155.1 helix-turn-helix domain-containing protein [Clostridia bacterium]